MPTPTIVQLVVTDGSGDTRYRMHWPAENLAQANPTWRVINLDARSMQRIEWALKADLLVIYQSSDYELIKVIQQRKLEEKKTLVEYNDNFYYPAPSSNVSKEWSSPILWQAYEAFMREADAVMTTSEELQTIFKSITASPIAVLKNYIPKHFVSTSLASPHNFVVGWGGSVGHAADLMAGLPVLENFVQNTSNASLSIMGSEGFKNLITLPEERATFTPWGDMEEYQTFLRSLSVGVILMLDTPYNRGRSDIKALEYTAAGALPIVPNCVVYRDFLEITKIKSYSSFDQLSEVLTWYHDHPDERVADLERCRSYLLNERVQEVDTSRSKLYMSLFPKTIQGESFGLSQGFHEIYGEIESGTRSFLLLTEAQKLLRAGDSLSALDLVSREWSSAKINPEILLGLLKISFASNLPETVILGYFDQASQLFPSDLRFDLLRLRAQPSYWEPIIKKLKNSNPKYRQFFRQDTIQGAAKLSERDSHSTELLLQLCEIFPDAIDLRYRLAQMLIKAGDPVNAAEHMRIVRDNLLIAQRNTEILELLDESYIETALMSTNARSSDVLWKKE